jgi:TPR repeat protein
MVMRNLMLVAARVSLFSLVLVALAACYVPPVWDAGDAVNSVDEIKAGETTRAEVLDLLGDPQGDPEGATLNYTGKYSDGAWFIPSYVGGGIGGIIGEEGWRVRIVFDEKDVVRAACTSEDDSDKRQACDKIWRELEFQRVLALAECGDADAEYITGYRYQTGTGVARDFMAAFFWYSLSSQHNDASARRELKKSKYWSDKLSPANIAEGKRLVAEWEPDPAKCGLGAAEAKN